MRIKINPPRCAFGIFVAAIVAAGCNGVNPSSGASSGYQPTSAHVRSLAVVSTKVVINNSGSATITGTGSAPCWTVSPTPLPSVGPGGHSAIETLSYDTSCAAGNELDITYTGPAVTSGCIFETVYNMGFSYKAVNSAGTACTVSPSQNVTYNENFNYASVGSLRKHR